MAFEEMTCAETPFKKINTAYHDILIHRHDI